MPSFQLHIIYNKTFKKDKPSFLKAPPIQVHSRKLSFLLFLKQVKGRRRFLYRIFPERIDPANSQYSVQSIPKVISGQTEKCKQKVQALYSTIFDVVVPVSSPKVAEMCKLFENIQRLVNISLVNELNTLCESLGIDFYEALEAASTKPFGFTPYWPGPGIGGHCIPVDPLYFQWRIKRMVQ